MEEKSTTLCKHCAKSSCALSQYTSSITRLTPCFSSTLTTEQIHFNFYCLIGFFCQRTSCQRSWVTLSFFKVFSSHPSNPLIFCLFLSFSCVPDYYFQGSLKPNVTTCNATEASETKSVIMVLGCFRNQTFLP